MYLYKSSLFNFDNAKQYSEEDYKIKFWAFVLEKIFEYSLARQIYFIFYQTVCEKWIRCIFFMELFVLQALKY
jgi:hypothetical protein